MKNVKQILIVLLAIITLAACGKDKDQDDYARDKSQHDLAQLQAANGDYTGLLQKKDKVLGGLQFHLEADLSSVPSGNQDKPSAHPILITNVTFRSAPVKDANGNIRNFTMDIAGTNGYYEPESGVFNVQLCIPRSTNASNTPSTPGSTTTTSSSSCSGEVVAISALIDGSSIKGRLYPVNYSDSVATFELTKNGVDLTTLTEKTTPIDDLFFSKKNFSGTTTFKENGVKKLVNLVLLKPESTSNENFLTMMIPVIPLSATLNYGKGADIAFTSASLDQRTGNLTGSVLFTVPQDGGGTVQATLSLSCNYQTQDTLQCLESTNTGAGLIATSTVKVTQSTVDEPNDSSATSKAIKKIYHGEGNFDDDQSKLTEVEFTVIYPARTRLQDILDLYFPTSEKMVQVSFSQVGYPGPFFQTVKWDRVNQTLDGTQTVADTGSTATMYLSCQHFNFESGDANYDFSCQYLSTFRNKNVTIRLHSN